VPADPLRAWADVIAALEAARELSLAGVYQGAKILGWSERAIEIGFPRGAMLGELAAEPAKLSALRAFLAGHLGAPIDVVVRLLGPAELEAVPSAISIVEAEAERRRLERDARQAEARAHPLTRAVLDTFGAEIKEIKTDV
jgi:hypothetical protein